MKKIVVLLMGVTTLSSAQAQKTTKKYSADSALSRLVLDINLKGGALLQDYTLTDKNLYDSYVYNSRGEMKFTNGSSMGFDAQLGYFFGQKRHFGLGAGFMYMAQQGDVTMNSFSVAYKAYDANNNVFRQIINSNGPIKETLKMTNMNIPLVLKYKNRFNKTWGFTADAGLLFNVQHKNSYTASGSFDYEATYKLVNNSDGTKSYVYDNGATPDVNSVFYTKSYYMQSHPGATQAQMDAYFANLKANGYNVALGNATSGKGDYSYTTGSLGFIIQPAVNIFLSDKVALNVGAYYMYQNVNNDNSINNKLTDKIGSYTSMMQSVTVSKNQSFGGNVGVRFFIGKPKDTDGDGIPDKSDKCPEVFGLAIHMGCPDTDKDGIADPQDSCATVPGIAKFNGCPDSDGDGIQDKEDECPFVYGLAPFKGCPDSDNDGIPDKDDACPSQAGPAQFQGCPDTDGDGLSDNKDKCPTEAGPASNNGCPVPPPPPPVEVERLDIHTPILFEVNKNVIAEVSYPVLDEAVKMINENAKITLIIEGHTDNTGSAAYNKALSMRRAEAVKKFLRAKGVPAKKLKTVAYGFSKPAQSNDTPEGRASNRRAQLEVKE